MFLERVVPLLCFIVRVSWNPLPTAAYSRSSGVASQFFLCPRVADSKDYSLQCIICCFCLQGFLFILWIRCGVHKKKKGGRGESCIGGDELETRRMLGWTPCAISRKQKDIRSRFAWVICVRRRLTIRDACLCSRWAKWLVNNVCSAIMYWFFFF